MNNVVFQGNKDDRLTDKEYWNLIYKIYGKEEKPNFLAKKIRIFIKTVLGEKLLGYIREYMIRSYADYLLWDVIYKKYLPKTKGLKVLEIGSAPGDHLVRLNQAFGFIPYGVEYCENGVKLNKENFLLHNIDTNNVIHADFFSDDFHKQYRDYFDIIISHGFIEHFTGVKDVIRKHIDLLVKGGYLIVSVPNFSGINYILAWIFHKWFLLMHNIDIMQRIKFLKIFDKKRLQFLFCGYYGTFNFGLFDNTRSSLLSRLILNFCKKLQLILNMVFRILFKDRGAESSFFSPYLIYIGIKKE